MSISEQERNELIELENKVAILTELINDYRNGNADSVERRKRLAKMQIELGKYTRRLRYLNGLI